jgi:DNA-binding CsgD family transcriptional regulator
MVILAIALKLITNTFLHKAFLAIVFVSLINILGVIFIGETIVAFSSKEVTRSLLQSPVGIMIGTVIEMLFPSIALFICSFYNISLLSPKKRMTKADLSGVLLFGSIFAGVYNLSVMFLTLEKYVPAFTLIRLIGIQLLIVGCTAAFTITSHTFTKKDRSDDQRTFENELQKERQTLEDERRTFEGQRQTFDTERRNFKLEKDDLQGKVESLEKLTSRLKEKRIDPQALGNHIDRTIKELQGAYKVVNPPQKSVVPGCDNKTKVILTARERSIFELIADGKDNIEIAAELHLTDGYVANVVTIILDKFGLADRTKLAVHALKNNLVKKE